VLLKLTMIFVMSNGTFSTAANSSQPANSNNYIKPYTTFHHNPPTWVCYLLDNSWNIKPSWKCITAWLYKFNINLWCSVSKQHTPNVASNVTGTFTTGTSHSWVADGWTLSVFLSLAAVRKLFHLQKNRYLLSLSGKSIRYMNIFSTQMKIEQG